MKKRFYKALGRMLNKVAEKALTQKFKLNGLAASLFYGNAIVPGSEFNSGVFDMYTAFNVAFDNAYGTFDKKCKTDYRKNIQGVSFDYEYKDDNYYRVVVTVESYRPGMIIGKMGSNIERLEKELERIIGLKASVRLKEKKKWFHIYDYTTAC